MVADDLTGAMDSGVQLAKWGLQTLVVLTSQDLPEADAVVVSTDSRGASPEEAYRRAVDAAKRLHGRSLYKKMDSAMRGNVGAELDGVLDGLGLERALVAPAAPFAGRATVDGYHRVNGVLLAETAFARDPVAPVTESHLPTLLARQTRRSVGHLPLRVVEQGVEAVVAVLEAESASIVAADAVEPRHLRTLALALQRMPDAWLPCGSAGLAEEWPQALGLSRPDHTGPPWPPDPRPVLVVAGSRHPTTLRQLQRAESDGHLQLVHLSLWERDETEAQQAEAHPAMGLQDADGVPGTAGMDKADGVVRASQQALSRLEAGQNVALALSFGAYAAGQQQAAAEALAQAAAWVLERADLAGMFITGGDTLRALCHTLGATALRILDEVQPGVPAGRLRSLVEETATLHSTQDADCAGRKLHSLDHEWRVVTKAGAFGDDLTIARSIEFIQGRWK